MPAITCAFCQSIAHQTGGRFAYTSKGEFGDSQAHGHDARDDRHPDKIGVEDCSDVCGVKR